MRHTSEKVRKWIATKKRKEVRVRPREKKPDLCFTCLTELVDGECPKCREAA